MSAVTIVIGATLAPLRRALARAGSMLRSFGRAAMRLTGIGALLGGAVAGFVSLRGAINGMRDAFDFGSQMDDAAARTGVMVGELVTLGEAFRQAGISADQVPTSIQRMQRTLVQATNQGGKAREAYEKLGLSIDDLRGMTAGQQFQSVAAALGKIEDPAERSAAAMEIFGRAGGQLVNLFRDPEAMNKAAQTLGNQAELLEKNAGIFDRISDLLGGISIKLRGFFTGVAERVGPMLLDVLERIDKIDLTGIGQNIGDAVMMLMESFRDGTFGDIIWLSMKAAWEQMVNYFTRVVVPAIASGFEAAAEAAIETTLKLVREIKGAVSDLLPTPPGKGSMRRALFGDNRLIHGPAAGSDMAAYMNSLANPSEAKMQFSSAVDELVSKFRESQIETQRRVLEEQAKRPPLGAYVPPDVDAEDEMTGQSGRSLIASLVSTFRRVGGETLGGESAQRQALIMQRETSKATLDVAKNTRETNRLLSNLNLTPSYV